MSFIISTFSSRHRRAKEFFLAHSPATMPELPTRWSVIFLNGFSLRSLCVKLRPQLRPHARSPHGMILAGFRCYERRDRRRYGRFVVSIFISVSSPYAGSRYGDRRFLLQSISSRLSTICAVVAAVRLRGTDQKVLCGSPVFTGMRAYVLPPLLPPRMNYWILIDWKLKNHYDVSDKALFSSLTVSRRVLELRPGWWCFSLRSESLSALSEQKGHVALDLPSFRENGLDCDLVGQWQLRFVPKLYNGNTNSTPLSHI